jgi:hypothetical protein
VGSGGIVGDAVGAVHPCSLSSLGGSRGGTERGGLPFAHAPHFAAPTNSSYYKLQRRRRRRVGLAAARLSLLVERLCLNCCGNAERDKGKVDLAAARERPALPA